jgi:UDP-N-acetylmuramoyl-tripeptide--D-alanyl-D-alanine ligase
MRFDVHALGTLYPCAVRSVNEAVVLDAVTAVAIAYAVGVDVADVMARLTDVEVGEKWRSELVTRADGVTIVNDAFESDAASMASALKTLTSMTYGSARAVAVLGEMTVDDAESRDEYDRVGRLVVRLNVGKLIVVGYGARHIHNAAGLEGSWDGESVLVESAEEAYDLLENELRDGDVVLVKSSKAAGLGFLGDRLGGKTA